MSNNESDSIKNYELIKSRLELELKESLAKGDTTNLLKVAEKLKVFIEETKKSLEADVKECLEKGDTEGMLKAADVLKEFVERVEKAEEPAAVSTDDSQSKAVSRESQTEPVAPPPSKQLQETVKEKPVSNKNAEDKKSNEGVGGFLKLFFNTKSFLDEGTDSGSQSPKQIASETNNVQSTASPVAQPKTNPAPKEEAKTNKRKSEVSAKEDTKVEAQKVGKEKIDVTEFASWANNLTKVKSKKTTAAVSDLIASLEESVDNCNSISEKLMSETQLLEGAVEALGLLDCECELVDQESRAIRVSQHGKLIGILKVAKDLNNPTRKELGELCIDVTREWGKNGSEPKGIFLFNAIRRLDLENQDDTLADKTIDDDFASMAEKNGICLLALEQLLFIVGSASINKVKSEKIVSKIVSSNGVVEQNDIHLL